MATALTNSSGFQGVPPGLIQRNCSCIDGRQERMSYAALFSRTGPCPRGADAVKLKEKEAPVAQPKKERRESSVGLSFQGFFPPVRRGIVASGASRPVSPYFPRKSVTRPALPS